LDDVPLTRPSETGTFTFEGQRFPVEDVSNPAALAQKISDDSGSIEKSQTEAMHATVKHLLDFYQEDFPGLEGLFFAVLSRYAHPETDSLMFRRLA
jgi:hypothetical protein